MKFSFVIPTYGNWELLHQLLFDIYKHCSTVHEILIMDDDTNDEAFLNGLAWWNSTELLPITHIRNADNLGFLKNSNKGIKMATGDMVCLVSTDVRIYQDIVSHGITHNQVVGGRYLDYDTGWNTFDGQMFPYLEGWLLCTYKDTWNTLKYFDERFAPNDMEDVDFSAKALDAGLELITYPEGYVSHIGAQSIPYGDERELGTIKNKEKFRRKWIK